MKRLLLLLLFIPSLSFAQSLDQWDVVREGYYKVVVGQDTLQDNFTRYDTALKKAYDSAENSAQGLEIKIIPPSYRFEYSYVDVDTTSETVYDTANVEDLTLRQVNMGYDRIDGERSLSYQAEAHGDSVLFEYFHNGQLLQKTLQYPNGGIVRDTLKDPPIDSIQVWVHGYWDKWVEPYHEIVDIAFLDTLGQDMANDKQITITADATLSVNGNDILSFDFAQIRAQLSTTEADEFWNNVTEGSLRLYHNSTRRAIDVVDFDTTNETGWLFFDAQDHTDSTATEWEIEFGDGTLTQPAADEQYGSEEVYIGIQFWSHDGAIDASGNYPNATLGTNVQVQSTQAVIGDALEGQGDGIADFSNNFGGVGAITILVSTYNRNDPIGDEGIIGESDTGDTNTVGIRYDVSGFRGGESNLFGFMLEFFGSNRFNYETASNTALAQTWQRIGLTWAVNEEPDFYIDGSAVSLSYSDGITPSGEDLVSVPLSLLSAIRDVFGDGYIDEAVIIYSKKTADYIDEEHSNLTNQSGFWSVSDVSDIGGATALSGSIDSSFTLSGDTIENATLSGGITNESAISGNTIQQVALSGNIDTESSMTGNLVQQAVLSGELQVASELASAVVKQMSLSGQIDSESSLSGQLIKQALLSGSIDAQSALSGNIIIVDEGVTSLSGSISTGSSLNGNLTATKQIQGIIESETELSGDVIKQVSLSGNVLTVSSLSADTSIQKALAGTLLVSSSISGELTPVGAAWGGTIDITNSPLYSISFEVKSMHKISIQDDPLYTINIKVKDE